MVAASRCVGLVVLSCSFLTSLGARIARKKSAPQTKFIAGVPVLNYDLAYKGQANLAEVGESAEENWVVIAKPGTSDTHIQAACSAHDAGCDFAGHPSRGGMPFFKIRGTEEQLAGVLEAATGHISFAEPDLKAKKAAASMSSEESTAASWGLTRIGVPSASNTGRGVHVYVCDTGVRSTHRDFESRAIPALDMSSNYLRECNGNKYCAGDADGHGTHCAGTVGGRTFGVAPKSMLHACKVLADNGEGAWSWTYSALDWIAAYGARPAVTSMSLGGEGTQNAMKVAVDSAVDSGVTVVVAAGNENDNACYYSPAFVSKAIAVGSTNSSDQRSYFSNYGSCVDIWAPGHDIVSASASSDTGSRTESGTSMACPHVSGGAALLLESNSGLRASSVLSSMLSTSINGAISGLRSGDVNKMLCVGSCSGGGGGSPATRRRRRR